ncbi:MAG: RNA-binding cell elongation regulator Jag/EloR [Anaerolineae bacterium]
MKEAITRGLAILGVGQDEVEIEILKEGSRGLLGFGAEEAEVRLTVKHPPIPEPARETAPLEVEWEESPRSLLPDQRVTPELESEALPPAQVGQEVLSEILKLMGVRALVEPKLGHELAEEGQDPPVVLNIVGDDLGILIGRRGETLKALQYLVRLMVSHRLKQWSNLVVDVEDYLTRRRHALESLALRTAERVVRTGRGQALEPMPAYERRWVHMALRNHPKVTTKSIGEGEKRKVTIVLK